MILTLKRRAGIGVKREMWIMHRTLGRWPSLEPTKNNLQEETNGARLKTDQHVVDRFSHI